MSCLPHIRHTITIGIPQFSGCDTTITQFGPGTGCTSRFHVCRQIYQTGDVFGAFRHTAYVSGRTFPGFFYNTFIDYITLFRATGMIQYQFIGLLCRMRRDNSGVQRFGQAHFFPDFFRESVVAGSCIDLFVNSFRPVIFGHFRTAFDYIAIYIKCSPYMLHRFPHIGSTISSGTIFSGTHPDCRYTIAYRAILRSGRSRLIIVVHDIHMHGFSTVATVSRPIIEDVVAHIHVFALLRKRTRAKAWHTTFVMRQQIMMERSFRPSPNGTVPVSALCMACRTKTFGDKTPLNCQILTAIHRTALIYRPTDRAMVDNHILAIRASQPIWFSTSFIADTKTKIAYNDIVGIDSYRTPGNTDTLSRRSLSGNGQISVSDSQRFVEEDGSRHIKYYSTCTFPGKCITQRTFLQAVLQRCHMVNSAATTTGRISPETFRTGKSD